MKEKFGDGIQPVIFITFKDGIATWYSAGWGGDKGLMEKAKRAINEGETEEAVLFMLYEAGFAVAPYDVNEKNGGANG